MGRNMTAAEVVENQLDGGNAATDGGEPVDDEPMTDGGVEDSDTDSQES
jgi:hypothetical protein